MKYNSYGIVLFCLLALNFGLQSANANNSPEHVALAYYKYFISGRLDKASQYLSAKTEKIIREIIYKALNDKPNSFQREEKEWCKFVGSRSIYKISPKKIFVHMFKLLTTNPTLKKIRDLVRSGKIKIVIEGQKIKNNKAYVVLKGIGSSGIDYRMVILTRDNGHWKVVVNESLFISKISSINKINNELPKSVIKGRYLNRYRMEEYSNSCLNYITGKADVVKLSYGYAIRIQKIVKKNRKDYRYWLGSQSRAVIRRSSRYYDITVTLTINKKGKVVYISSFPQIKERNTYLAYLRKTLKTFPRPPAGINNSLGFVYIKFKLSSR